VPFKFKGNKPATKEARTFDQRQFGDLHNDRRRAVGRPRPFDFDSIRNTLDVSSV
jgi:hypothetical protein